MIMWMKRTNQSRDSRLWFGTESLSLSTSLVCFCLLRKVVKVVKVKMVKMNFGFGHLLTIVINILYIYYYSADFDK